MRKLWDKLVNGLRSYCQDNGFSDAALGLSGGIDSALTAVLAADALGGSHIHAYMMKTKYTSVQSLEIAKNIAEHNGLHYQETDIQPLIDMQTGFLHNVFNDTPKNIVLENLQARERGKILMALSNQYNYLVLACGNKSEAAMGYCTLYGDTCGGLSPIGGLYKTQVFELAKWRNSLSPVLPEAVIRRAPSAELSAGQKDEDTLPSYAVLDRILKLHIEEKQSAEQIAAEGFDPVTAEWVVKRYATQAFKRRQLPPALPVF